MAHPSPTALHSNDWLDLVDAAEHADVPYRGIVRAVTDRELTAITTHPRRPGDWLVREAECGLPGGPATPAAAPWPPANWLVALLP